MRLASMLFALVALSWAFAEASNKSDKTPVCTGRPDFVTQARSEIPGGLEGLPKMIFVGKKASYYVESKVGQIKLLSEQTLGFGKPKFICATLSDRQRRNFSIYAPVLLDLTAQKSVRESVWQFQMMANSKQVGLWNQKVNLPVKWTEQGLTVRAYQTGHDEFEIVFLRDSEKQTEYLAVTFEAVDSLN